MTHDRYGTIDRNARVHLFGDRFLSGIEKGNETSNSTSQMAGLTGFKLS
ncbi:hypothetical protein C7S13_8501 [Burkholderia cepacia]|nr:hypothetical protein [Burkholderia cepacia]